MLKEIGLDTEILHDNFMSAYKLVDYDESGTIDKEEMSDLITNLLKFTPGGQKANSVIKAMVEKRWF